MSLEGVFVVATSALPDDVGAGDRMQIALRTPAGEETLSGVVRWRGYHPVHQAIGCGIQLDQESMVTLAQLFPVLRQPTQSTS